MSEDANQSEEVLLPTTTSGEGIEAHLEAADSSPASDDKHETKSNGVQDRINDLTAKRYQVERERDQAERERDELKAKLDASQVSTQPEAQSNPVFVPITAPKLPDDMYDDDAMRKYHSEMLAHQEAVAKQQAKTLYDQQQKAGVERAQQDQRREQINTYASNAVKDGVDLDKLRAAEQALEASNISPELGQYLMSDQHGGKIATYLAENPSVMHEVLGMSPMLAAAKIATEIKPLVLTQAPAVTNAPQPITQVRGGGVEVKDDFDKTYAGYEII